MSKNRTRPFGFASAVPSLGTPPVTVERRASTPRAALESAPTPEEINEEIAHLKAIRARAREAFMREFPDGAKLDKEGAEFLE